jgi:amino acid transporter
MPAYLDRLFDSVVATGVAILAGATHIRKPFANFREPFEGSTTSLNSLSVSLVKANHAFVGWHNAFYVLGEMKGTNPVRTVRKAGFISLAIVAFLCFFANVAYVAAVPREEIRNSGQLIAALFFRHTFGDTQFARLLPAMVAMSCLGNIVCLSFRLMVEFVTMLCTSDCCGEYKYRSFLTPRG